jgi:hypothetical protein
MMDVSAERRLLQGGSICAEREFCFDLGTDFRLPTYSSHDNASVVGVLSWASKLSWVTSTIANDVGHSFDSRLSHKTPIRTKG